MRIVVTRGDSSIQFEDDKQAVGIKYSDENAQLQKLIETMVVNLKKLE